MNLRIDPRHLHRLYLALGITNTLFLGVFGLIQAERLMPGLVEISELDPAIQFNMVKEHGILAVWYSSSLFLLLAFVAVLNLWSDRGPRSGAGARWPWLRYGWLLLAAIGLFLSADESAQLHDGVGLWAGTVGGISIAGLTDISPRYVWLAIFAPVAAVCAFTLAGFFLFWLGPVRQALIPSLAGIACWLTVPVMEFVESRLAYTFGPFGVREAQFLEEALEVVGATALIIGALQYLIWRGTGQSEAKEAGLPRGGVVLAGIALPLLLLPVTGAVALVDQPLRSRIADSGYRYSGGRIFQTMELEGRVGRHVVLTSACDLALVQAAVPGEKQVVGSLVTYPDGVQRASLPRGAVTVVELTGNESPEAIAAGLTRLATLSDHVWYMRCGDTGRIPGSV